MNCAPQDIRPTADRPLSFRDIPAVLLLLLWLAIVSVLVAHLVVHWVFGVSLVEEPFKLGTIGGIVFVCMVWAVPRDD